MAVSSAGRQLLRFRAHLPPRAWLIRGLVLASIALLVAGAVAPLLTTERFYFISNTFSLASALIQLAARQQYFVAALIVVFSFCVPVAKAVATWRAVSDRKARRHWFSLAERFGKWSMLEVFVAALLIAALKLDPVVEATLHYGVWLLAASVVISGIASQLIARAPSDEGLT